MDSLLLRQPDQLIPDYDTAYHIVDQAVKSHHDQWQLFRAIQEHIEGKKPISPEKLKQRGLSWASNFNFGKARSQIEKSVIERVKKIADALMLNMPEFRAFKDEDLRDEVLRLLKDPNDRGRLSSIVGYCFFEALEEEGYLYDFLNSAEYNAYTFGFSPVEWRDENWSPTATPVTRIAFRPGSRPNDVDCWVVFRSEKALDLYQTFTRIYNKEKIYDQEMQDYLDGRIVESPKKINIYWNSKRLGEVLCKLLKIQKQKGVPYETWGDVAPDYNDRPGYIVAQTADLNLAAIYQRELDGSITEIYIPWGYQWANPKGDNDLGNVADDGGYILYRRNYKNKEWTEFLRIIKDSGFTETGDIHAYRGAGKIAVENSIRYNRLRNSLTDKSQLVGIPVFEQPATQSKEKFKLTMSQGFAMIPSGYTQLEKQPNFDINSHMRLISHEDSEFNDIASHYREDATGKLSSRPTKDEVQLAQMETQRLRSSKDKIALRGYAEVFFNIIQKIPKPLNKNDFGYRARQKFFKLLRENLPELKSDDDVLKILSAIDGLQVDLINTDLPSLQMALQMAETPFGRNRLRRMILISKGFSVREVNLTVPIITDKYRSFDDRRVALIEQDMFWTSGEVVFSETDDHIVHLQEHDKKIKAIFEQLRANQLDVVVAYDYLVRLYSHSLLHIEALGNDPVLKGTAEQYLDVFKGHKQVIGQVAYTRNKVIKDRQEAAQMENPGISPKDAHDIRLKDEQAKAQEQRNQFKTVVRAQEREKEMENKHQQRLREIELDHQADMAEIQAKSRVQSNNPQ